MRTPDGYSIKRVYIVICDKCNEDITRPVGGNDVETLADAHKAISEHAQVWHQ